ncbi:hypothetical protein [Synechococcus sp. MIT S9508]|uniref:hypothetical protein n=1 Tax=Synechococcus sp. MIT S9508 TaxID=1801629 RepID=UPI0007BB1CD5|nr:hypothetical protein [Synechococcus sp. MIT S9508]KZR90291.1 hypothetical protein MITS9508_00840 [Synechococcus sp. MIT S9508]
MSRRRSIDRTVSEGRFQRDSTVQSYRSERAYRHWHTDDRRSISHKDARFRSELGRDFAAMKRVWQMLRYGAIRMIGEIGRQY